MSGVPVASIVSVWCVTSTTLHAEDVADLHDARARLALGAHLHQHQLALDRVAGLVLEDLDHVDELVQLLRDLLERLAVRR